jgi:hypothetical protein
VDWLPEQSRVRRFNVSQERRAAYAHRVAYELLVGPIPEGLTLDHVRDRGCTSTACVKAIADERGPAHLEPVTMEENVRRASARLDVAEVVALYESGLSTIKIARRVNADPSSVWRLLERNGVRTRSEERIAVPRRERAA